MKLNPLYWNIKEPLITDAETTPPRIVLFFQAYTGNADARYYEIRSDQNRQCSVAKYEISGVVITICPRVNLSFMEAMQAAQWHHETTCWNFEDDTTPYDNGENDDDDE